MKRWQNLDKQLVVSEFGFRTRNGADVIGPAGPVNTDPISMLAHKFPVVGRHIQPRIKTIRERNEALQADCLIEQLELLDRAGVDGAFVHTFTFPLQPHSDSPRHDLDADNLSLVKTLPHGEHGLTYPDMPWEPKQAFAEVADFYAKPLTDRPQPLATALSCTSARPWDRAGLAPPARPRSKLRRTPWSPPALRQS